jgi:hypothetical protein
MKYPKKGRDLITIGYGGGSLMFVKPKKRFLKLSVEDRTALLATAINELEIYKRGVGEEPPVSEQHKVTEDDDDGIDARLVKLDA